MTHITFAELCWLFLIYSFFGWGMEALVGSIKNRKFTNRGFSTGPFCPVYGIAGALMEASLWELSSSPLFLFIGCAVQATFIEWTTGKLLERLNRKKWWDYSGKKWNFDGYICLEYTLLWGLLGMISVKYINTWLIFLYYFIPDPIPLLTTVILSAFLVIDALLSLTAVLHLKRAAAVPASHSGGLISGFRRFSLSLIGFVERRMQKAYPLIEEKSEEIIRRGRFAEGCSFYKLFWLFLIGAFLGDITETIFCRLTAGVWMSRSSLVWGPFSIVWGLAIAIATALLYKDKDKPDRHIFLIGTFLGGAYEYACSVFTEIAFGKVFWDYSDIPFNLGGRINLLYCFFWGIAAVVWIKLLYPHFSEWIEKIPKIPGYVASWILILFMAADISVSAAALVRYDQRAGGKASESGWESIIDNAFDDSTMQRIYPNAVSK